MTTSIPTASGVFEAAGIKVPMPLSDRTLLATCEQCGVQRRLSDCPQDVTDAARTYRCPSCADTLVIVRAPYDKPVVNGGYRLGDWVLANAVDVSLEGMPLVIPASYNATTVDIRLQQGRDVGEAVSDEGGG